MTMGKVTAGIAAALAVAACAPASDDAAFDARVRRYLLENPDVLLEMQAENARRQQAAADIASRELIAANADRIFRDDRDPSIGPADAKKVVVAFIDYQCSHCKAEAAPVLLQMIAENPDVRFVFKEYPIFGEVSQAAARSAIASARQEKYLAVFETLMAAPAMSAPGIEAILRNSRVDVAKATVVADSAAVQTQIDDVNLLARDLSIYGTPAFVLGETIVMGTDKDRLLQYVGRPTAGNLQAD